MKAQTNLQEKDVITSILSKNPNTGSYEEVKNYEGYVYLRDGQNFVIRMFNKFPQPIAARINVNGKSLGDSILINPGQKVDIERFLDEKKKFVFKTYDIDSSDPEVMKAIEKNGDIQVELFQEKRYNDWFSYNIRDYDYKINPNISKPGFDMINLGDSNGTDTTNLDDSNNISYTSSINTDNTMNLLDINSKTTNITDRSLNETGRVEKGEHSQQNFVKVDKDFENYPFLIKKLKILPFSKLNFNDDVRIYCVGCGYRIRKRSWNFCPKCGEKIEF